MARVKKRRIIQQTGKRGTSKNAATGQWRDEPDKDGLTRLQRRFNRLAGPVTITYIDGPDGPISEGNHDVS
jgi:hypothetical protein